MTATPQSWLTRSQLGDALPPGEIDGLLLSSPIGDAVVPLRLDDLPTALDISRATLSAAGIGAQSRVVIALNSDGDLGGALLAMATAGIATAAAPAGPRGRMRLLQLLRAVRANTLVITPTGAMDLLARLHLEFLVDPLDLGLERLILTGEIADPRTRGHLAAEFDAQVTDVYCDPVLGIATAAGADGQLVPSRGGLVQLGELGKDELNPDPGGYAELVLTPTWHSQLSTLAIRTGHVVSLESGEAGGLPVPRHTVGEHVLIRGRWLSVPRLVAALARIDGIASCRLVVARPGTLDVATLRVAFNRPSLAKNPMWRGRIVQAIAGVTPVAIAVAVDEAPDEAAAQPVTVVDERGQHLAIDRAEVG